MSEHRDDRPSLRTPDAAAVAAAHAVYTPLMLRVYDRLVHGISNRFAWRCPTERLLDLYRTNLSPRHLEAGVGTGFFIDRANPPQFDYLSLLDINRHCLARSAERLARYRPVLREANLFSTLPRGLETVGSIGLTYVLHCLPGRMPEKLGVVDHLRPLLAEGGVLFGATILGRGVAPNAAARALLASTIARASSTISTTTSPRFAMGLRPGSIASPSTPKVALPCSRPDSRACESRYSVGWGAPWDGH